MEIYKEIIGNIHAPGWAETLMGMEKTVLLLDQWTAQKSRFVATDANGQEYAIALKRNEKVADGDILDYQPHVGKVVVVRIELSPVLVIDLLKLASREWQDIMRICIELGHAIGNQHWPAVVKGTKVFVPLTVDKKVMQSVMDTHHLEGIEYRFHPGAEVIPYLAPHEIRRLFGGAGQESHSHSLSSINYQLT